jgi:hypothetical protein
VDAALTGMRTLLLSLAIVMLSTQTASAHCDAIDGPVVTAARDALRTGDFTLIAVWVKPSDEAALQVAFKQTLTVRALGDDARALADLYFFETAVRLHRAGEGEPYTGLAPAGSGASPALTAAETALRTRRDDALVELVVAKVRAGLHERFRDAVARRSHRRGDIAAGRAAVASYVDFIHYTLKVYTAATVEPVRHETPIRHEH